MGASNFGRTNASSIFAVLMDREEKFFKCDDCKHCQYEYDADYLEPNSVTQCPECESESIEWGEEYRSVEDFEIDDFFYNLEENIQRD
jgi:Zn finger protein HypA/HybF involved in hydrogenase expression